MVKYFWGHVPKVSTKERIDEKMNIWHDINGERIKKDDFVAVIEIQKNGRNKYEYYFNSGALLRKWFYRYLHKLAKINNKKGN